MYRVARKSADLLRISLVTSAAMLAICLLALVETTNMAEAEDSLPQNGKIAFAGIRPGALGTTFNWEIYTVNADGSERLRLTNNTSIDTAPAWSPDGTKIAFTREDTGQDIYVMNADGTEQRRLTSQSGDGTEQRRLIFQSGDNSYPAWSPDGTKIAFTSTRDGSHDIFIMDADGGNVTKLTDNSWSNANPSWSPDGSKVVFDRSLRAASDIEIYTMNVDGTGEKALTNNPSWDRLPDWSPDSRRIVYDTGSRGVFVMNADGTEQSLLARGGESPAWSPDGKKILFSERRFDDEEIAAINPDGSGLTHITRTPRLDVYEPDWQPLPRTVHQPDTGGLSLLLVASALLFSGGTLFYAGLRRRI